MKQFITSDWHFGHKNICGENGFVETRKHFKSVEEMNQEIIKAINSVVTDDDELYHLGDISLKKAHAVYDLLMQINGQIHLVKGNHDSSSKHFKYLLSHNSVLPSGKLKFVVYDVGTIKKSNGIQYYLTHYPLELGEHRRTLRSLCGHIHDEKASDANCLNVGIDSPELPKDHPFAVPLELELAFDLVDDKWDTWKKRANRG